MSTLTLARVHAALVHTSMGVLELAWSSQGLCALRFAEGRLGAQVEALYPEVSWREERPEWVDALAEGLTLHLRGEAQDLRDVPLDLGASTPFQREVYAICRELPAGEVATYGQLAQRMGRGPGSARAIGGAMGRNPVPLVVPCHRVVGAAGLVGFTAPGGLGTKRALLELEGWRG